MKSEKLKISAVDARAEAQKIAFAPVIFQVVRISKKVGILKSLKESRSGLSLEQLIEVSGLSEYGTKILVEMLLTGDIVSFDEEKGYELTKIGYFLESDQMTIVNMNFVHDVCYKGLFHLEEALREGKPAGLKELGDWPTIYEGLSELEADVQKSWFDFDHYYSDTSFDRALELVFSHQPKHLIDVGGNTGKWALKCADYNDNVKVTIVDLPGQIKMANANIMKAGHEDRVNFFPHNMLNPTEEFPKADAIWMSQFLDCFSESEIVRILSHAAKSMDGESSLFIMETFWDNQQFKGAAYSLTATSVYFTAMANGNSKMYGVNEMKALVEKAGLKVADTYEKVGISHTILRCTK